VFDCWPDRVVEKDEAVLERKSGQAVPLAHLLGLEKRKERQREREREREREIGKEKEKG